MEIHSKFHNKKLSQFKNVKKWDREKYLWLNIIKNGHNNKKKN